MCETHKNLGGEVVDTLPYNVAEGVLAGSVLDGMTNETAVATAALLTDQSGMKTINVTPGQIIVPEQKVIGDEEAQEAIRGGMLDRLKKFWR